MKKFLYGWALVFAINSANAQKYEFQTLNELSCHPVISQGQTGTCWSFSATSFLESEVYRTSGKKIDLSEMYSVRHTYPKKVYNYIMRQGKAQFGEGGLCHDVLLSIREKGLVPQSVFEGVRLNSDYNHEELAKELEAVAKKYANEKQPNAAEWKAQVESILDKHIGKDVKEFQFEGKHYTPQSFWASLGLNVKDYVTLTSFNHAPFYETFVLDVPDNFSNVSFYNLPLDEFIATIDHALEKGYTLGLDADVSEPTFSPKYGIAVLPSEASQAQEILTEIRNEVKVTQELRQQWFEDFTTQDDHLMHIVGKVKDQKGNTYYKVKNSWGSDASKVGHGGFIYMSVPYMRAKGISVLVHKAGLPKATRKSLSL